MWKKLKTSLRFTGGVKKASKKDVKKLKDASKRKNKRNKERDDDNNTNDNVRLQTEATKAGDLFDEVSETERMENLARHLNERVNGRYGQMPLKSPPKYWSTRGSQCCIFDKIAKRDCASNLLLSETEFGSKCQEIASCCTAEFSTRERVISSDYCREISRESDSKHTAPTRGDETNRRSNTGDNSKKPKGGLLKNSINEKNKGRGAKRNIVLRKTVGQKEYTPKTGNRSHLDNKRTVRWKQPITSDTAEEEKSDGFVSKRMHKKKAISYRTTSSSNDDCKYRIRQPVSETTLELIARTLKEWTNGSRYNRTHGCNRHGMSLRRSSLSLLNSMLNISSTDSFIRNVGKVLDTGVKIIAMIILLYYVLRKLGIQLVLYRYDSYDIPI